MKIIAIGDLHVKDNSLKESIQMLDSIYKKCFEESPDLIVVLGDSLHWHERIEMHSFCHVISFFKKLKTITKLIVLIGNHDRCNPDDFMSEIHPFTALKDTDIEIVDKSKCLSFGKKRFCFVPYVYPGRFKEAIEGLDWNECDAIFAHQEFKGCNFGSMKSEIGDVWEEDNPLVISGHIHDYHWLSDNILYVGTPAQHGFGETSKKSISVFDFSCHQEDKKKYEVKRITLGLKERKTVRLTCDQIEDYVPPDDSLIRVVVEDTEGNIKTFCSSNKYEKLSRKVCKLSLKPVQKSVKVKKNKKKFLDMLEEEAKGNIGEEEQFKRIFGNEHS